jgi:hypothetical protein
MTRSVWPSLRPPLRLVSPSRPPPPHTLDVLTNSARRPLLPSIATRLLSQTLARFPLSKLIIVDSRPPLPRLLLLLPPPVISLPLIPLNALLDRLQPNRAISDVRASYLSHSASRSEPPSNLAPPLAPFPSPLFVVETATVRAAPIHPLRSFSPPRVPLPPLPATAPFSSIGRDPSWPSSHPKLARKTARPPLGAEDDEEEGHRGEKALQTGWSFPPSPHVGKLEIEGEERGGEGDLTRSSTPSDSGLVGVPFFSYQSEDYDVSLFSTSASCCR